MTMLKVEFEEAVWQKIIDMLAERPYREAGPVIAAIAAQFQQQREASNGPMEIKSEALHQRNAIRREDPMGKGRD